MRFLVVLFAALLLAPQSGSAQMSVRLDHLNGVYDLVNVETARERIVRAIKETVSSVNMIKRPLVRKRLREGNQVHEHFQVLFASRHVLLRMGKHEFSMPTDGTQTEVVGFTGSRIRANARVEEAALIKTFFSRQGTRHQRYIFGDNGNVFLNVTITSKHLPQPFEYQLRYQRAP